MPTTNQLIRKGRKAKKHSRRRKTTALDGNPQMQGVVLRTWAPKPKKPNSGFRKLARVRLRNGREVTAGIPGEGHQIREHSVVLVHGGRIQDMPGVRYKIIRGVRDASGVEGRRKGRSRYGTKR